MFMLRQRAKQPSSVSEERKQLIPHKRNIDSSRSITTPKTPQQVTDGLFERVSGFEAMASFTIAGLILLPLWYFGITNMVGQITSLQVNQEFIPIKGLNYIVKDEVEFLWEEPETKPRGLLFLAHGCSHGAYDWWPKSDRCPICIGLPEETSIVTAALGRGYIALAVTSVDRSSKCWLPSEDIPRVIMAINFVLRGRDIPLFAFGASSGGGFVIALGNSHQVKLSGIAPQIAAGHPQKNSPPIIFSHMPRDSRTAMFVDRIAHTLRKERNPVAIIEEEPLAISPSFFSDRIDGMTKETSADIQADLYNNAFIDEKYFLKEDPRRSDWRSTINNAGDDTFIADKSPISELMNVAWAQHEMSATHIDIILDFFESPSEFCDDSKNNAFCD